MATWLLKIKHSFTLFTLFTLFTSFTLFTFKKVNEGEWKVNGSKLLKTLVAVRLDGKGERGEWKLQNFVPLNPKLLLPRGFDGFSQNTGR